MKEKLKEILDTTLDHCMAGGLLKETAVPDYVIEVPNNPDHGHFATNLPMILASTQKTAPRRIAEVLTGHLQDPGNFFEKVEVAGPGFINFTIDRGRWHSALADMVRRAENFGRGKPRPEDRFNVEFVSANPTGPLHLGHGRGAALGDTLCRILAFRGRSVTREFYVNDAGLQIRLLGESILSRIRQMTDPDAPFPENGYHGDYVLDLAREIAADRAIEAMEEEDAIDYCARQGKARMLKEIQEDLERFGVRFDVWYSEKQLLDSGSLDRALERLDRAGLLYEEGGALWIRTSRFGDDKDRVIRKSDGRFTYFASDIAYHLDKRERDFTRSVDLWGADHHGYVSRLRGAMAAFDIPGEWFSVLLIQLVKLWKGGNEVKMSKRAGTYVTLRELMDEVGVDAVRFVFLTKSHDSPLDFDVDLVKKKDSDNPVYYVQYAHARICSVFRKAREEGIGLPRDLERCAARLVLEEEMAMIRRMTEFPSLLEDICRVFEPHRLTYYLTGLAAAFHRYFNLGTKNPQHRIVVEDRELAGARLLLAAGVRTVLANGLALLGVSAPEKM
ncbi:MAG: arginine--tRNA ligase [Deltaproteobacteria bacterium]|nr:arginine--tRNA ligase [Deltaproteobacteria bacterium]